MILRWIVSGVCFGKPVDDIVVTCINNAYENSIESKHVAKTLYHSYEGTTYPVSGFDIAMENAITIAMNRHICDKYEVKHVYLYKDDGQMQAYDISDIMGKPK